MSDRTLARPWLVIRQDANGDRYRVGRCATRAEAQSLAERLAAGAGGTDGQHYLVEHVRRRSGGPA